MPLNFRCITQNMESVGHKLETHFQHTKSFNDAPLVHFDNQILSHHSKERKGPTYKVLQIKPHLKLIPSWAYRSTWILPSLGA